LQVSLRESEIRSRPGAALSEDSAVASSGFEGKSKDLTEAIESLPEILSKKANLEAHTNILQAVMTKIASREVPTYFELEQGILTAGRVVDKAAVLGLLRDGSKGNLADKGRLLVLVAVSMDANTSKGIHDEYDAAFVQGCAAMTDVPAKEDVDKVLAAASFTRRLQALQSPMSQRFGGSSASSTSNAMLSSLFTSAQSKASSLMAKAASFFTKFTPMYITRVVDSLAEGKSSPEDESFCSLDPRAQPGESVDLRGQKYSDVIVFVIGGGCYSEFFNLQELVKQKAAGSNLRNVSYGCSELLSGDSFLRQLEKLGPGTP
jgi:sec1 family domain-containing protein 1